MTESASPAPTPEQINSSVHYLMYSVFARTADVPVEAASEAQEALNAVGAGFTVRGWYDVAGFRADADLLLWSHAPSSDTLQDAYEALRATRLGHALRPVWSQVGLHRPAEFNKTHVPAFLSGEEPHHYLCVYPFVRSREWYLLPDSERSEMLREHGMMARPYPDVRANTVASFALGDYEWLLGFEAEELHRIVDLMRDLRKARARAHMREELPFFTGRRRELAEILASWNGASWNEGGTQA